MTNDLRAMQVYLHPTRREALTATEKAITRWSLETNQTTILAQMPTAPGSLFDFSYSATAQVLAFGGITGSPDGLLFAHEQLWELGRRGGTPSIIEWRHWNDLSLARSTLLLGMYGEFGSLACSPDGHWLVLESAERLFLLDWQTGEVLSSHEIGALGASRLTFDTTSTFVAGVLQSYDPGCFLRLWRLDPAERFVPRPPLKRWPSNNFYPQDEVSGNMALITQLATIQGELTPSLRMR